MGISVLALLPLSIGRFIKKPLRLNKKDTLLIITSGFFLATHFGLWITSLSYTSIASSVVLVTSHPIFVAVISWLIWHEKLDKTTFLGITVALVGLIVLNFSGLKFNIEALGGNLFALIAGLSMGIYLLIGNHLRKYITLIHYLTMVSFIALSLLLVTTLFFGYNLFGYNQQTYFIMALLAVVPQLIGHSCLNIALRRLRTTTVSVAILGEPIGAVLLGYLILGETPNINELLGSIVIIVGISTVILRRNDTTQ